MTLDLCGIRRTSFKIQFLSMEKLGRESIRLVGILRKLWLLKISLNEAKEETEMERQRNNERKIGGKSKERRRENKQPKKN